MVSTTTFLFPFNVCRLILLYYYVNFPSSFASIANIMFMLYDILYMLYNTHKQLGLLYSMPPCVYTIIIQVSFISSKRNNARCNSYLYYIITTYEMGVVCTTLDLLLVQNNMPSSYTHNVYNKLQHFQYITLICDTFLLSYCGKSIRKIL